ncbi:MAG TPA: ABC transporter substrate-binding protein [Terriglobales bacterium]|jgi:NitT/TauT family transport system substrate-binding protein|nr:ABC transporter substrate-binding protein [Terriglobales bacterium]
MAIASYRRIWGALLFIALCSIGQAGAKPITLSYNSNALNVTLPIAVAQEMGYFAAEGLEVTAVYVRSGPTAMTALVSGSSDYTSVGSTMVIQAIAKGVPALVIGNYIKQVNYVLIGAKGIAHLNALKGRVVGVTGAGGMTEFTTVESLARKGLRRDRDYKIQYSGNSPVRVGALEAGIIQAAPFSPAERVVLEQKGFPVILDMGKVIPEFPMSVLATSRHKAETNPAETTALLRAFHRAMELIRSDKDRAIAAAVKKRVIGDASTERKALDYIADDYSIVITKENIQALITAAGVADEARKLGGAEKFSTPEMQINAVSRR